MPEHKIHCPSCDQHLAVPEELGGQKIDCPACNKPLAIPDFAHAFDEPEEEEPPAESPSRKSPALIAGIAGVVLIMGAIGLFALSGNDPTEEEQPTSAVDKTANPGTKPEAPAKTYDTWEEYKAASQAEGWHYDIAEYVGDVPDEENFFMAKPFSGFLYTMKVGEKAVYLNPTIKTDFEAVMALRVHPQHRIQGRQFADRGDFAKQLRLEPSRARYGNRAGSVKGTDQEMVDRYFAKFDGLIGDLREAAKRPKQNFPYPLYGPVTLLPHISRFKGITQLLQHSATVKLAQGDADGAMEDVRLQFRLFEAVGSDIFWIGQLVHAAIGHIIVDGLSAGVHMGQWSDEQLAEWDKLLTLDRDYLKQWERCMQGGERLNNVLAIESAINGVDMFDDGGLMRTIEMAPKQWLVEDLIFFDSTMKKYIWHIQQARATGRVDQKKFDLLSSETDKTITQKRYVLSGMFLPALGGALNKPGRLMNKFSAARLGIAIERYRRVKGTLPGDLSDLVPEYIGAPPNDAFTGEPLAWEHHGSPRYKIPVSDTDSQSWKYDGILAAIQAGDLGKLKAFAAKGWKITRPEGGSIQPPESNPNMAGMMPGMFSGPKKIDFSATETEILTQQNALHHAVHSGNLELLQWLIKHGLDPNATASVWTPEKSNASMPGMMPGMMMPYGMGMGNSIQSVLEFASNEGQTEMVKALRDAGASPVRKKPTRQQGNPLGMGMMPGMMPPGMGMNPFGMGIMDPEEEIKAINERLAKGLSLNRYNEWGQTELMIAVEADDIDLARRLLENKAHPNATSKDSQLDTALHLAAMQENKAMCELLLDKGARVNKKNKIGFTPLDAALYANEMPGFGGAPPEPSAAGQATVALLKSKGGTSMTPEERAKANPGMGGGMMPGFPGGMPGFPDPFMPPGGNPFGVPNGNQPPKPQRP